MQARARPNPTIKQELDRKCLSSSDNFYLLGEGALIRLQLLITRPVEGSVSKDSWAAQIGRGGGGGTEMGKCCGEFV